MAVLSKLPQKKKGGGFFPSLFVTGLSREDECYAEYKIKSENDKDIPREGLLAEYLFNNNTEDTSGNKNNLTNNNVTFSDNKGVFSGSAVATASSGIIPNGDFSVSFWIKANTYTSQTNMITSAYTTNHHGVQIFSPNGNLWTRVIAGNDYSTNQIQTEKCIFDGVWHHCVLTKSSTMNVYVDGENVGSKAFSGTMSGNTTNLNIGGYNGTATFAGSLDQIRIYDRVLTENEIEILCNEFSYPLIPAMTSDTCSVGTVSAYSSPYTKYPPYKAFDGKKDTEYCTAYPYKPGVDYIQFEFNETVAIDRVSITAVNDRDISFRISTSEDGSDNFIDLCVFKRDTSASNDTLTQECVLASFRKVKIVRLTFDLWTDKTGNPGALLEMQVYGVDAKYAREDTKTDKLYIGEYEERQIGTEPLYLYKEGDECADVTGGWSSSLWSMNASPYSVTSGASNLNALYFKTDGTAKVPLMAANNAIDLTEYSQLKVEFKILHQPGTSGTNDACLHVEFTDSKTISFPRDDATSFVTTSSDTIVMSKDISSYNGLKYIPLYTNEYSGSASRYIEIEVYKVWLEPKETTTTISGFSFPRLTDLGTYTVSSGTDTMEILIDTPIEYYLEWKQKLYLYKEGDQCTDVTGGWINWFNYESGSVTFETYRIHFYVDRFSGGGGNNYACVKLNGLFDPALTLCVELESDRNDGFPTIVPYVADTLTVTRSNYGSHAHGPRTSTKILTGSRNIYRIPLSDISPFSTVNYLGIVMGYNGDQFSTGKHNSYVYNIWLE